MPDPIYFYDKQVNQFRDARGRFVSRVDVRAALDDVVDRSSAEIERFSKQFQSGEINLAAWRLAMEANIKTINTAAGAIGKGGWQQASQKDWGFVGAEIKVQYVFLRSFAREIEDGLPLDGRFLNRAKSYAMSATGTYEAVLRKDDLAIGFDEERRFLHAVKSCDECKSYAARGWTKAGTLPGIGQKSPCTIRCRCTFERRRKGRKTK